MAHYFLRGVQADAQMDGSSETFALLNRLLALPGVGALTERAPPAETQAPVLPILFRQGDIVLRMFTTVATLDTPRDVTLQKIRIECFFPMDDATTRFFP